MITQYKQKLAMMAVALSVTSGCMSSSDEHANVQQATAFLTFGFDPNPLEFRRTDSDKIVKYTERQDALPAWNVPSVTYGTALLDPTRWSFPAATVFQDPTSSSREQGTLHFNSTGLASSTKPEDVLLRWLWQQSSPQTISIAVDCVGSSQTHTLLVKLMP